MTGSQPTSKSKLTPAQRSYLSRSDELIEELQAADTVVIGAPMYNSSIPSPLKAWIDQIVRLGKTVGHGPTGPQGLLARKKAVVITSRGSTYEKGTARGVFDFQELYVQIASIGPEVHALKIEAENAGLEIFMMGAASELKSYRNRYP
jgi:FMN-dependent NADH-azoreductase